MSIMSTETVIKSIEDISQSPDRVWHACEHASRSGPLCRAHKAGETFRALCGFVGKAKPSRLRAPGSEADSCVVCEDIFLNSP